MTDFTNEEIRRYYQSRIPDVRWTNSKQIRCKCPVHNGDGDNFAIDSDTGLATCHSRCQRGWDILGLEMELSSRDFPTAKKDVFHLLGRPDLKFEDRDIIATYDYTDADGNMLYQVVRKFPKKFVQRRPAPSGEWTWGLGNVARVPFQLPLVIKADAVAIVEGEKDALSLTRHGIVATCNNGGAGNWAPELNEWFKGKRVAIIPDNDQPGREHALKVAQALYGVASVVRIAEIPKVPDKGDVSDFFASGRGMDELKKILAASQKYTPEFQFSSSLASEDDKWVRTSAEVVAFHGGRERFWNMTDEEGIPTPFTQLTEDLAGGLRKGEVYLLAGQRGEGKTSMLLQFISKALRTGHGTLLFSLEMGDKDVLRRLVGMEERVNLAQVRLLQMQRKWGSIQPDDEMYLARLTSKLHRGTERTAEYPLLVHQKPAVNPDYIIQETKRLSERQRIKLLCIDHAQLMASTGNEQRDYEKFTRISRALKGDVARELQIPVLVVSQVSRNAAYEKREELEITDLRGSGAWEEDAAAVMLLYHNRQHVAELKAAGTLGKGPVRSHLKLGKGRFGPDNGVIELTHFKTFTRFESTDERDYEPEEAVHHSGVWKIA